MNLVYPAVFYPDPDSSSFAVTVPDLPGCVSGGDSLADAIAMGEDAASGWILRELEDGKEIPRQAASRTFIQTPKSAKDSSACSHSIWTPIRQNTEANPFARISRFPHGSTLSLKRSSLTSQKFYKTRLLNFTRKNNPRIISTARLNGGLFHANHAPHLCIQKRASNVIRPLQAMPPVIPLRN